MAYIVQDDIIGRKLPLGLSPFEVPPQETVGGAKVIEGETVYWFLPLDATLFLHGPAVSSREVEVCARWIQRRYDIVETAMSLLMRQHRLGVVLGSSMCCTAFLLRLLRQQSLGDTTPRYVASRPLTANVLSSIANFPSSPGYPPFNAVRRTHTPPSPSTSTRRR